jgi:hypothetical protein
MSSALWVYNERKWAGCDGACLQIPATQKALVGGLQFESGPRQKCDTPSEKIKKKRAEGVTQVVEQLPSKHRP